MGPSSVRSVERVAGVVRRGLIVAVLVALAVTMLPRTGAHALDADEVGAALDRAIGAQMTEHDIPGAVAVVVDGARITVARGYGLADRDRGVAVDPARTRFDIGSVTKLFTATAVMQLVEQGLVDLDADVNAYLSAVQVPATYAEPVTTAHLLTHTAGFDERNWVGWFTLDLDDVEPLGANLARNLPPRIRPPGELHQYNNHGMGLAGHVVESVSGQLFDAYVVDNILGPLGMVHTTFGDDPGLDTHDAVGYQSMGGAVQEVAPWYLHLRPAGGIWTTGEDMAAFMLAHLGLASEGSAILSADSIARMHSEQFVSHPAVPGLGYGFFQGGFDGRRAVQHGGGWVGFGSALYLVPDLDLGIFVAFNHGSGALAAGPVIDAVLADVLGDPVADVSPANGAEGAASAVEGRYRWSRHDRHSFMRLPSLLSTPVMRVIAQDDGSITTSMTPTLVADGRWAPTEQAGVFVEIGGARTIGFDLVDGRAERLHVAGVQLFPMERAGWHQTPAANGALLGVLLLAMLAAAIGWPLGALRRRRRRGDAQVRDVTLARRLAGTLGILGLGFFVGLAALFAVDPGVMLAPGVATRVLLWLPLIAVLPTAWLAIVVMRLWSARQAALAARVHLTTLALAFVVLLPALYHWRLLGFHY